MSDEDKSNVKLGLFVLAGSFLLILTLYLIGKNENFFGSNIEVRARFQDVQGLTSGNNVHFSGIQVGTVKGIRLINDTTLEVTMLIDNQMRMYIHRDALVSMGTEGLMGNKILNITPGRGTAALVENGDLLSTRRVSNTDEMLMTLDRTNRNLFEFSEEIKNTVHRLNSSKGLWSVLDEASLSSNLKSSLNNISQASANVNEMMKDLHGMVSDVKIGKGSVGALLKDTSLKHNLEETLIKIKLVGDRASDLANELNGMAVNVQHNIQNGTGIVHALMYDTVMVRKLNSSLDNIQEGTEAFNQDMQALKHNFLLRGYFKDLEKEKKDSIK
jgi:phospholipid/cholesterol/gamma-HCH transport system substrate-binding protein